MGRRAVFLDRDGTIVEDRGFLGDPAEVALLPGAAEGLLALARAGFLLVVVSNQSGVARGLFSESAVAAVNAAIGEALRRAGGPAIDAWYSCPHLPEGIVPEYARPCDCRKPAPGMILRAARELGIDLAQSVAVGDRARDVEAGRAAGVGAAVLIGPAPAAPPAADHVAPDLLAAARWILERR